VTATATTTATVTATDLALATALAPVLTIAAALATADALATVSPSFLFQLNSTTINCILMPTKELSPSRGLDCKAESRIQCQANNDEKHLVVVWLQTESTGKVAVMVVAHIEHKPEGLGTGDEFEVDGDVVQHGLRTGRHRKEKQSKMEHPFLRMLVGPERF
jgi:hypothetical protein